MSLIKMFVKYDFLVALQANEQYHQEFKPPPEGSMTGVGRQEQVIPVQDMSHDQDQIQQRYFLVLVSEITLHFAEKKFNSFLNVLLYY